MKKIEVGLGVASLIPLKSAVTKSGTGTWDLVHEDSGTPRRGTRGHRDAGTWDVGRGTRGSRDVGRGDAGTWDAGLEIVETRGRET